jgi:glyoxylase-like metal-dependent hydrolase (beta-lactamase superfamily II)
LRRPAAYGFPESVDLFDDAEVVLCDARGHTPGNVAVALRTGDHTYVHVGDAVYQSWEYSVDRPGPSLTARLLSWDREHLKRTYAAIRATEADPRRPTIVPSHDNEVFERLPHTPASA